MFPSPDGVPPAVSRPVQAGAAALVLMLGFFPLSLADPPAAPEPGGDRPLEQVTIEARRELRERVSAFVGVLTPPPGRGDSVKRWVVPLCPLVAGLGRDQGEFILSRLSQIARAAGVPLAGETCHPNLYVVASADPDVLLQNWERRDRHLFGRAQPAEVRRFIEHERPVRVWYNASYGSADAGPTDADSPALGVNSRYGNLPTNARARDSRLFMNDVQVFSSVLVIVDLKRVQSLNCGQLTDYIAMLTLTQIPADPTPGGGVPSILQLFSVPPPTPLPAALTAFDAAFLKALYSTEQAAVMQRSAIITSMLHDIPP